MRRTATTMSSRLLALITAAAAIGLAPVASADSLDEMPREAAPAQAYYEADPDLWITGPVQYLMLDGERDVFEKLATRADRAAFIRWFWDRRDPDLREPGNPFRDVFYERVAEANRKYRGFPRGWKSDRGQVHVVIGRPHAVRPLLGYRSDATVWTYYTVGPHAAETRFGSAGGAITVAFLKSANRAGYRIYGGFGGPGTVPLYVLDALEYSRLAAIVDPMLEGSFGA